MYNKENVGMKRKTIGRVTVFIFRENKFNWNPADTIPNEKPTDCVLKSLNWTVLYRKTTILNIMHCACWYLHANHLPLTWTIYNLKGNSQRKTVLSPTSVYHILFIKYTKHATNFVSKRLEYGKHYNPLWQTLRRCSSSGQY